MISDIDIWIPLLLMGAFIAFLIGLVIGDSVGEKTGRDEEERYLIGLKEEKERRIEELQKELEPVYARLESRK